MSGWLLQFQIMYIQSIHNLSATRRQDVSNNNALLLVRDLIRDTR